MPATPQLLSHRLRGFSAHESSLSALRAALAAGIPSFEVDTRVTADGEILVYHDAWLDTQTRQRGRVSAWSLRTDGRPLFRGAPREQVPTLRELLAVVRKADPIPEILLDIKDFGAEAEHADAIREAGLQEQCWIVSWLPEVLLRMHAVAPELRLSFSHLPLTRRTRGWQLAARASWGGRLPRLLGRLGRFVRRGYNLREVSVHLDACHAPRLPEKPVRGGFPVHLTRGLPRGPLGDVLRRSGGSVGVDPACLTRAYVARVRAAGLKLFVFRANSSRAVDRLRRLQVDRIFTDNAALFERVGA